MTVQRTFHLEDQQAFASLSGDYNPLHLDPLAARRSAYGRPVVHGIHLVLWGLDAVAQLKATRLLELVTCKVQFRRPALVGANLTLSLQEDGNTFTLSFGDSGGTCAIATLRWRDRSSLSSPPVSKHAHVESTPVEWNPDDASAQSGTVRLPWDSDAAKCLFPGTVRAFPQIQLATLLASTTVVGMRCPGKWSIFADLDVDFGSIGPVIGTAEARYQVTRFDPRFNRLQIAMQIESAAVRIKAYLRPAPRRQASSDQISSLVTPGEFSDQRALIIGGSRGLGELTAKLLAAGGADVLLTYARGKQDAERVVQDINSFGGTARCVPFDVSDSNWEPIRSHAPARTHLYPFATPAIFVGSDKRFQSELFHSFSTYYVDHVALAVETLEPLGLRSVFYPSSTALDTSETNMAEYIAAKAAGEALCSQLNKKYPRVATHVVRLPRMDTDQTATFIPVDTADAPTTVLLHLRQFHAISAGNSTAS